MSLAEIRDSLPNSTSNTSQSRGLHPNSKISETNLRSFTETLDKLVKRNADGSYPIAKVVTIIEDAYEAQKDPSNPYRLDPPRTNSVRVVEQVRDLGDQALPGSLYSILRKAPSRLDVIGAYVELQRNKESKR
jgi:hypothetical protein